MNLAELAIRTGIPRRRLRYVLDHALIPQLRVEIADEAGRPRHFREDVGFAIVCAVRLLDMGLRHEAIRRFLGGLLKVQFPHFRPPDGLLFLLEHDHPACGELGDGKWVRLRIGKTDSDWIDAEKHAPPKKDLKPAGTVMLDLGQIRDLVYARPANRRERP